MQISPGKDSHLLDEIISPTYEYNNKLYPKNQPDQYMFDRGHNVLDITDTIRIMENHFYKDHSARHTTPMQVAEYFTYASSKSTEIKENIVVDFLIAPFSLPVWILALLSVIFLFLLPAALRTTRNFSKFCGRYGFFLASLGCFYLAIAYSSNLKALLTTSTANDHFENLYDLAKKLKLDKKL